MLVAGDGADGAVRLSRLDGFLTAVASGPLFGDPSALLAEAFEYADGLPTDEAERESLARFMLDRYAEIEALLRDALPTCIPIPSGLSDGASGLRDWARGYLDAVHLLQEAWKPFFEYEQDDCVLIVPIAAAAAEDGDAAHFELSTEKFRALQAGASQYIPSAVVGISEFWESWGDKSVGPPMRRPKPKTRRNAPCPCGSGKKYKRCCGA